MSTDPTNAGRPGRDHDDYLRRFLAQQGDLKAYIVGVV